MKSQKKKLGLSAKMLIGMALGLIVGIIAGPAITWIKPFGTVFVNLLKMCMVPVIFISITLAIAQVADLKVFGRIGIKIFVWYCLTSAAAAVVGIFWALIIKRLRRPSPASAIRSSASSPPTSSRRWRTRTSCPSSSLQSSSALPSP